MVEKSPKLVCVVVCICYRPVRCMHIHSSLLIQRSSKINMEKTCLFLYFLIGSSLALPYLQFYRLNSGMTDQTNPTRTTSEGTSVTRLGSSPTSEALVTTPPFSTQVATPATKPVSTPVDLPVTTPSFSSHVATPAINFMTTPPTAD